MTTRVARQLQLQLRSTEATARTQMAFQKSHLAQMALFQCSKHSSLLLVVLVIP